MESHTLQNTDIQYKRNIRLYQLAVACFQYLLHLKTYYYIYIQPKVDCVYFLSATPWQSITLNSQHVIIK